MKKTLLMMCFFISTAIVAFGQDDSDCNRYRIGIKSLVPNILGGTAEYVIPAANNRWSVVLDYSRFGLPKFISNEITQGSGEIKATLSYLAIGPNFYLNQKGRAGGAYLGLRYQQIDLKTSVTDFVDSATGKATQSAAALLFGLSSAGRFWAGMEIGAGYPLGAARGTYVENGSVENYSESIIPVIPIFNFKMGVSF
jgi:hypothetical protein